MPIYEFYCADCHTVFSFLSRKVSTRKRPSCPRCGRPRLERQASRFAVTSEGSGTDDRAETDGVDESRLERAVESVAHEIEGLRDDDPRVAARLMRRMYDEAGVRPGAELQEALHRLEAGEDPERIEDELGDALGDDDPLFGDGAVAGGTPRRKIRPPAVDETLYDL